MERTRKVSIITLLVMLMFAVSPMAWAAEYFVAKTGSDSNSGSDTQPWSTIQKAANVAQPGDTVYVKAGTYNEEVNVVRSGTSGNLITFKNYRNDKVVIQFSGSTQVGFNIDGKDYIKVEGFEFIGGKSGIYNNDSSYTTTGLVISNNYVHDTASDAMFLRGVTESLISKNKNINCGVYGAGSCFVVGGGYNNIIEGNEASNPGEEDGIKTWGTGTIIRSNYIHYANGTGHSDGVQIQSGKYNVLENNIIENARSQALMAKSTSDPLAGLEGLIVRGNVIYMTPDFSEAGTIRLNIHSAPNSKIYNNTVHGGLMGLRFTDGSYGDVKNNIFYDNDSDNGVDPATSSVDYNIYWGASQGTPSENGDNGAHSRQIDPRFLDPANNNFHLLASSPAIDAGTSDGTPTADRDGNPRYDVSTVPNTGGGTYPYYDIGAYELQGRVLFVAKNGSDSNLGTQAQPFLTIQKGINTAVAGDTVLVRGGVYNENPDVNNKSNISLKNYSGEQPIVRGENGTHKYGIFSIGTNASYITLEGFTIDEKMIPKRYDGSIINGVQIWGSHNIVRNMAIKGSPERINPPTYNNFYPTGTDTVGTGINMTGGASYNLIEGNTITDIHWYKTNHDRLNNTYRGFGIISGNKCHYNIIRGNTVLRVHNASIYIGNSGASQQSDVQHDIIIENNTLGDSVQEDGIHFDGGYYPDWPIHNIIVRNNHIYNHPENGIDLKGTKDIKIYGNVIHGCPGNDDAGMWDDAGYNFLGGVGGIMHGSSTISSNVSIYNNIIYDNNGGILAENGYKIFNNVIYGNNKIYSGSNNTYDWTRKPLFVGIKMENGPMLVGGNYTNVVIKNNIIGGHRHGEIALKGSVAGNLDINHNLYSDYIDPATGQNKGVRLVRFTEKYDWDYTDLAGWKTYLQGLASVLGKDANSLAADPKFVNLPGYDFHLQAGSPAIDKGTSTGAPTTDKDGNPRLGAVDIGAYEYRGTGGGTLPDTTLPTLSILSPANSAKVSGGVDIQASASDNVAISKVEFYVDNALKSTQSAPLADGRYGFIWNSQSVTDGNHSINAKAYDNSNNFSQKSISVSVDNTAPIISGLKSQQSSLPTQRIISWSTNEPADSRLEYGLTTNYGYVTYEPGLTTAHAIELSGLSSNTTYHYQAASKDAADNEAVSIDQAFTTGSINRPPVLNYIGNKTAYENKLLSFMLYAADPDANTLTYSATNLPQGASFNAATKTFSWTPTYEQAGSYAGVRFEVSDGSLTDFEEITITVINVVQPITLIGKVTSIIDNSPLASTSVILKKAGTTTTVLSKLTDASGNYTLTSPTLAAGQYDLYLNKAYYAPKTITGISLAAGQTSTQNAILETTIVSGKVLNQAAVPVKANIYIKLGTSIKASGIADANGVYKITNAGLASGTYDIVASAIGYVTQTKKGLSITANKENKVDFIL